MKKLIIAAVILIYISIMFILIINRRDKVDMILTNGKIYTLDSAGTVAEAIAIKGNKITGIGSTSDVTRKFNTEKSIDLKGRMVIPGLIDGHAHILGEGGVLETLDLAGTSSVEQIAQLVSEKMNGSVAGDWIIGRGWDQNNWTVKEFPDKSILDRIAPGNPVFLRRVDGHAVWVNSKAMEIASIDKNTKDPEGGRIFRDRSGVPSGIFVDNAVDLVYNKIPELTDDEIERRLKLAMGECARLGLTGVHDMGVDRRIIRIYKKLIDQGECPVRIYAAIDYPSETWNEYLLSGPEINYGDGFLTVRSVKLYMDGALGSRGAAMVESYADDPGNRGITILGEKEIDSACLAAYGKGFQVCTHAIGDRANNIILNAYEKIFRREGISGDPLRWRIEHAQILLREDIGRFRKIGVLPAMQPTHATSDMDWAETRVGPIRINTAYAWRSLLRTGSIVIGGSDFPVESVNPLFGIYAAVTRQDKNGDPPGGWHPEQKMDRHEALSAFTSWPSFGAFQEAVKGTIEIGKWADLTVLNKDIMEVPVSDLLSAGVKMTIVGGKIIYENN